MKGKFETGQYHRCRACWFHFKINIYFLNVYTLGPYRPYCYPLSIGLCTIKILLVIIFALYILILLKSLYGPIMHEAYFHKTLLQASSSVLFVCLLLARKPSHNDCYFSNAAKLFVIVILNKHTLSKDFQQKIFIRMDLKISTKCSHSTVHLKV